MSTRYKKVTWVWQYSPYHSADIAQQLSMLRKRGYAFSTWRTGLAEYVSGRSSHIQTVIKELSNKKLINAARQCR